jgi:seryl-tRNA synthetase
MDAIKMSDTERRYTSRVRRYFSWISKDIGEMMKKWKSKAAILKKTVLNKEKSKKLAEISDAIATELTDKLYSLPNLPLILYRWVKRLRKT